MQQRFENVPYSLMTCWSLMQRRESGTRLDQCLLRKLDIANYKCDKKLGDTRRV